MLTLAPGVVVAASEVHHEALLRSLPLRVLVASTALAALAGGWILPNRLRAGRLLGALAIIGTVAVCVPALVLHPAGALAALVVASAAIAFLWNVDGSLVVSGLRRHALYPRRLRGAAAGALACAFAINQIGGRVALPTWIGFTATLGMVVLLSLLWARWAWARQPWRVVFAGLAFTLACVAVAAGWGRWRLALEVGAALSLALFVLAGGGRRHAFLGSSVLDLFVGHLERMFVGTFAVLCLAGALLLALPQSAAGGQPIDLIDALFTSVSAVCVTGLVVLDTPVDFSEFGQVVIVLLIQLGGLGIMTFSTAILRAFGRRMSLRHEGAVARMMSTEDRGRLYGVAQRILLLTFGCEAVGAVILAVAFASDGQSWGRAAWLGLFTSVSAFCNAGFALDSASLVPHADSPVLLHTVALLIILGGLSPAAVIALPRLVGRRTEAISAQIRLGLTTTAILLVVGFGVILALEWDNALAHLAWPDRIHNAWFQSVTLRTAGFNSIELGHLRAATWTLMLLWMFIGGNPGGTAGGIKTTTAAILAFSVVQSVRGHWTLDLFGRRISDRTRHKAAVTVTLAVCVVFGALFAIQLTQVMPTDIALFEVVSALGTVGLSLGGTGQLDEIGKIIVAACMFVGRVGGMSLLMFLGSRREAFDSEHPQEEIDVG